MYRFDAKFNNTFYEKNLLFTLFTTVSLSAQTVFINELHYDNAGSDVDEFIEIAGPAGTNLTGWTVELYNGSNGSQYETIVLTGTIDDEGANFGALAFAGPSSGIQNGGPDGLALIDNNGTIIQFLSYEGSMTATSGIAIGLTSTDIGVSETSSTPIGQSLQLTSPTGTEGTEYTDFEWTGPSTASMGSLNVDQDFPTLSTTTFKQSEFSVFPNPTSNGFVNIKTANNQPVAVVAYDVLGKQVLNTTLTTSRLNVSNLKAGVYILKLTQNGATTTKKLVIE